MVNLTKSASKIVLLTFAATACAALFTRHISPEIWAGFAGVVFGYYFGRKGDIPAGSDQMGGK